MYIFDNHKYSNSKRLDYTTIIRNYSNTSVLEIGINKPVKKRKPKKHYEIKTQGVKKELLEYHYGIYRMFPCGKQHNYHMRFMHIPGVTERRIIG